MKALLITAVGWLFLFIGFGTLLEHRHDFHMPLTVLLIVPGGLMAFFGGRELNARITGRVIPDSSEVTGRRSTVTGRVLANLLDLIVSVVLPKTRFRKK